MNDLLQSITSNLELMKAKHSDDCFEEAMPYIPKLETDVKVLSELLATAKFDE